MNKKLLVLLIIAALAVGLVPTAVAQDKPFAGQKVVVVTQEGRSIGGPIEDYAPEWEALTGGEVELQQFAWNDLFEKTVTALSTGSGAYDMLVFPAAWSGDYMAPGYLEPIPRRSWTPWTWTMSSRSTASASSPGAPPSTPCPTTVTRTCSTIARTGGWRRVRG